MWLSSILYIKVVHCIALIAYTSLPPREEPRAVQWFIKNGFFLGDFSKCVLLNIYIIFICSRTGLFSYLRISVIKRPTKNSINVKCMFEIKCFQEDQRMSHNISQCDKDTDETEFFVNHTAYRTKIYKSSNPVVYDKIQIIKNFLITTSQWRQTPSRFKLIFNCETWWQTYKSLQN